MSVRARACLREGREIYVSFEGAAACGCVRVFGGGDVRAPWVRERAPRARARARALTIPHPAHPPTLSLAYVCNTRANGSKASVCV